MKTNLKKSQNENCKNYYCNRFKNFEKKRNFLNLEKNNVIQKSTNEIFFNILKQEGLIHKFELEHLKEIPNDFNVNVFFGTGLSNPREITKGVPFDILNYILVANKIRNKTNENGHIHHLIADNHTLINGFNITEVKKEATKYRWIIEKIIDNLNIKNYHIYLSSEVSTDINYKNLIDDIPQDIFENKYAKFESADIEYFRRTRSTIVKLGWKFKNAGNFDESYFDNNYQDIYGKNIVPVYIYPGKRIIEKGNDVVPYTLFEKDIDVRFIVSPNESVVSKIANASTLTLKNLNNHYKKIIRIFEETIFRIPVNYQTTWEKLQFIIDTITK